MVDQSLHTSLGSSTSRCRCQGRCGGGLRAALTATATRSAARTREWPHVGARGTRSRLLHRALVIPPGTSSASWSVATSPAPPLPPVNTATAHRSYPHLSPHVHGVLVGSGSGSSTEASRRVPTDQCTRVRSLRKRHATTSMSVRGGGRCSGRPVWPEQVLSRMSWWGGLDLSRGELWAGRTIGQFY